MNDTFSNKLNELSQKVSERLPELVDDTNFLTAEVSKAAIYSLNAGGKRLRPVLMQQFYQMISGDDSLSMLDIFCTIELIHTFSLIHDDLPCMDNDDFRRGKPSCHKVFPEAIALLAGDQLNTLPFEIISDYALKGKISYQASVKLCNVLSRAVGVSGMIGGQVIDMMSEGKQISLETLNELQAKKTGALIAAACEMGCVLANADSEQIENARKYAQKLGLAFQIRDDILDVIGSFEELGKPIGSDKEQSKSTYVSIFGVEESNEICRKLTDEAVEILESFENNEFLKELTLSLLSRKN
ncbi:MAG: polyprenyl synthetase family protein [Oscillospiraceae bacterium]|nr:polyprenyl synthetase family protein [Oscillospiraceae bacterium]